MSVLRLAIVDPNDATREGLKATLLGLDTVWLEAECSRYDFFADVIEQTNPDIGFVAMDSDPERALQLIAEIADVAPNCAILVSSSSTDGGLILQTMRAGAKEFLPHPLSPEDLVTALQRVTRQRFGDGAVVMMLVVTREQTSARSAPKFAMVAKWAAESSVPRAKTVLPADAFSPARRMCSPCWQVSPDA